MGTVDEITQTGDWVTMWFRVPPELGELIVSKGSVAVDGVSLTLVNVEPHRFSVALIPHTLTVTTLGRRAVNLLNAQSRGRLNGIFVGLFFVGGAIGSAVSGLLLAHGGWPAICAAAALFGLSALIVQAVAQP